MNSSPPQPIDSLASAVSKEAYEKVARLCVARRDGINCEEELAKRAPFASVEVMRISLANWGLSALLPLEEEPRRAAQEASKTLHERKARQGGGEAKELPDAKGAADLLRVPINNLTSDLEHVTDLKEVYKDGRFYAMGDDTARGASPYPIQAEVRLITAYLMDARNWREVELLVQELHPEPEIAEWETIKRLLTGETTKRTDPRDEALLPLAKKLATLVRGGTLKRGRNPARLDLYEHGTALVIEDAREQGVPEAEIRRKMREWYGLDEREFDRLAKIHPPKL